MPTTHTESNWFRYDCFDEVPTGLRRAKLDEAFRYGGRVKGLTSDEVTRRAGPDE